MKGQELKRRITGINETVKITKAMQMISAAKMHKLQQKYDDAKKYLGRVSDAAHLVRTALFSLHPYLKGHDGDRSAFIVIAGDKGLCGDYNHLVLEKALENIQNSNVTHLFPVGYIARDFFKKKGYNMITTYIHLGLDPMPDEARTITDDIIQRFVLKEFDNVYIVYTGIKTLSVQNVVVEKLLPLSYTENENAVEFLPGEGSVDNALNHYILAKMYYALTSSSLAINYKRMIAMQQSTTNGEEIISELKLQYNHKRQESITTELVDASASLQGKRL